MLTLLLGTDWIRNREEILQQIADDVAQQKSGRIYMVPEFISHDTERRLCEAVGDAASRYVEVLSFTRLCGRVCDSAGHKMQECLDNGGRLVAMASATRQLHSRLKAYASVETKPEFLTSLVDAIDEFKRCCITSVDLMDAAAKTEGSLAQKLEELALILECYDALCENGNKDPCDQMTWLLSELECSNFAQEHVFYIDGFPDFTRQHMAILEHLIQYSPEVTVSFNCDSIPTRNIGFEKAADTALQIFNFAKRRNIPVEIRSVVPREDALSPIRRYLFQGYTDMKLPNEVLQLHHAETVYQECLAAAQRIKKLICSGARYRDISVVCTDIAAYRNSAEMVFRRCHIPAYISGTEDILNKSVISTVLAAVDTALGGFEQQDVFQYIKSSLTPLELNVADKIENYARMWGINGSRWLQPWGYHPDGLGCEWTQDSQKRLDELNIARERVVRPLLHLRDRFRDATYLAEQIVALYEFLEDIALRQRLELLAQEYSDKGDLRGAQILNQLWEILISALEQLYDVLGKTGWDWDTFTHLFRLLLSQYDVGTIPPVLDSVTVGAVSAMRCQQTKHLILLGAQEGLLPGYAGSTGVLTDQERTALRRLGVPLTGGALDGIQAELAEIYGVFSGATETVSVSCSGGQSSFVYQRLLQLGQEVSVDYSVTTALCDALEAGAYLTRTQDTLAAEVLGIETEYQSVLNKKAHTLGNVNPEHIRSLYGKELKLSASQVDKLADCRLSYFLRYGLRAKEQRAATVDPAEFGTYVHDVLENTAREIKGLGGFRQVSLEKTMEIAQKHSTAYAAQRFSQIDSQRLNYLFRRNSMELEKIVRELWEELQNCDFEPLDFEVAFGDGGQMPSICIHGQIMDAQLRGFVDRVDTWQDGDKTYFRVVDYKTGRKDFDYCDVFNGLNLQMLLYLFALEQEGDSLLGEHRAVAGVQYFPARVPLVSSDSALSAEEAEEERRKLWKRSGLLLNNEAVLDAMEHGQTVIRLPIKRKKDGSVSGDLADEKQLALLKLYVFGLLGKLVDEIASGDVTANPYTRGSSHNACSFCPYTSICHLETVEGRRNYKAMSSQLFWESVEKEVETDG